MLVVNCSRCTSQINSQVLKAYSHNYCHCFPFSLLVLKMNAQPQNMWLELLSSEIRAKPGGSEVRFSRTTSIKCKRTKTVILRQKLVRAGRCQSYRSGFHSQRKIKETSHIWPLMAIFKKNHNYQLKREQSLWCRSVNIFNFFLFKFALYLLFSVTFTTILGLPHIMKSILILTQERDGAS